MATNTARSAITRGRILDGAFECLVEIGYARTSTVEVLKRAAVSRGALLHHFPRREQLLAAAVEHVFVLRLDDFRAAFAELPDDREARAGHAIEVLWEIVSGPPYYAWLELLVAARTDPALREEIRGVMERFGARVQETYDSLFPGPAGGSRSNDIAANFALATLNGLALDRIYAPDEELRPVVDGLKYLATVMAGLEVRR